MDVTIALDRTDELVGALIAGLEPSHRDQPTPCTDWTVHDLIAHMCAGGHAIAGGLRGEAPPTDPPDPLADGPRAGWASTMHELRAVATPEILAASHQMPFGEVSGEQAMSVILADHVTHAWDLARATDQDPSIDDELAAWSLEVWKAVVPAEGRTGDGFAAAVEPPAGATPLDLLVAYTGRQP